MRQHPDHAPANPIEYLRDIGFSVQPEPQRQRVGEEPDQIFSFQPATVGAQGADHEVVLSRIAMQHSGECGEQGHRNCDVVGTAQIAQRGGAFPAEVEPHPRAVESGCLRPRSVGVELQWRRTGQITLPVLDMRVKIRSAQMFSLPLRIVRVLDGQLVERYGSPRSSA